MQQAFEKSPALGKLQQVAEGVWWLKMPLPFELDHINLYLLEDKEGWTIIDTGLGGKTSQDIWLALFAGPLAEKPLRQVICTHYHPDHIGSAGWLCERFQVPLLVSRPEYEGTQQQLAMADDKKRYQAYLASLGLEAHQAQPIINAAVALLHMYDPLPETWQPLQCGQTLQIAGNDWQIQLSDGHSPAHATLYCPQLKVLISGDQVLPRITSNVSVRMDAPEGNPLACWLKGLDALSRLPDDTLVLPAHDEPFYGLHKRLDALRASHMRLLDKLLAILESDDTHLATPQTTLQLAPQLYSRKLNGFTLLLALGECQAHLHYLLAQGQITYQKSEQGVHLYAKAVR